MDMDRKAAWNREADRFQEMLGKRDDCPRKLLAFLRRNGALREGCQVADIGCGVGKYALLFAELGCGLLLVDIADNMMAYARENLNRLGASSRQVICDWSDTDPEEMGWTRSVDLAFASMTPAISSRSDVEKLCRISRGFCFVSKFLIRRNLLLEQAAEACGTERYTAVPQPEPALEICRWVIELGFLPRLQCLPYDWENLLTVREAETMLLQGQEGRLFAGREDRLRRFLKGIADPQGLVTEKVRADAAWILWSTDPSGDRCEEKGK